MRRRDSNPAEASTLAASQVNPPRALLRGWPVSPPAPRLPVAIVTCDGCQAGYATRCQVLPRTTLPIVAWLTPYSAARYA